MARSSLLGVDSAPAEPAGRDKATLGPGDSSDTGSDVAGLDSDDDASDPGLPVDVALRDDQASPLPLGESLAASEGEAGVRDGADIGVDRVFTPGEGEDLDDLLDAVDTATSLEDEEGEERPGDADAESSHRPGRS
ncbi:hypothetical protein ACS5PN_22820 [Roseateles sp. NT4]|uniref:hypothetical protein n=1 Tax=Roseateles sp. NT4 TaxID=3453715 RepID=UPI003EEE4B64